MFQGKLGVMLPESFVTLPAKLARIKYSSQQRPQVIRTSRDTTVNFGMSLTDRNRGRTHQGVERSVTGSAKKAEPCICIL